MIFAEIVLELDDLLKRLFMRYWFRPIRFWKFFASYYPSSTEGWICTFMLGALGVVVFLDINKSSYSASDTFISFLPWLALILLAFDSLCFRMGEYPSWWKRR